jgi:ML-like domain
MRTSNPFTTSNILSLLVLGALPARVFGDQTLKTSGFSTCLQNSNITVNNVDIQYNNDNQTVTFNVAGQSSQVTNVTAVLIVTAYGNQIYNNTFNPCDSATYVKQLCPGK